MEKNKVENEEEVGAMEILRPEEYSSIFVTIIIFLIGWFSILSDILWVKFVGWAILGFVLLSLIKIGKILKRRIETKKEEIN